MNTLLDHPPPTDVFGCPVGNCTTTEKCVDAEETTSPPKVPLRSEILQSALRSGVPLHIVEDYFDWLDMCGEN